MSLNVSKLEKVRELANGVTQARCPACAEGGGDRSGQHLRIYPDGRFGCCVHPKDAQHRKRIFALAGDRTSRGFRVRVSVAGRPAQPTRSVKEALTVVAAMAKPEPAGELGTLGTGEVNSVHEDTFTLGGDVEAQPNSGTLGTPFSNPRAYAREDHAHDAYTYKDSGNGVPSVPNSLPVAGERQKVPFLTADGTLSIPFGSPERYHWWKPGERMTIDEIVAEVRARAEEVSSGAEF